MNTPRLSVQLWGWFILALVGAGCAPQILFAFTRNNELTTTMFTCSAFIIGPVWVIWALILIGNHGRRALWVLIGLPIALYCPAVIFILIWACATGRGCL